MNFRSRPPMAVRHRRKTQAEEIVQAIAAGAVMLVVGWAVTYLWLLPNGSPFQ